MDQRERWNYAVQDLWDAYIDIRRLVEDHKALQPIADLDLNSLESLIAKIEKAQEALPPPLKPPDSQAIYWLASGPTQIQ